MSCLWHGSRERRPLWLPRSSSPANLRSRLASSKGEQRLSAVPGRQSPAFARSDPRERWSLWPPGPSSPQTSGRGLPLPTGSQGCVPDLEGDERLLKAWSSRLPTLVVDTTERPGNCPLEACFRQTGAIGRAPGRATEVCLSSLDLVLYGLRALCPEAMSDPVSRAGGSLLPPDRKANGLSTSSLKASFAAFVGSGPFGLWALCPPFKSGRGYAKDGACFVWTGTKVVCLACREWELSG